MIRLIIFDISGVISNKEEDIYLEEFSKRHDIPFDALHHVYFVNLEKAEKGEIPLKVVWEKVFSEFHIDEDYNEGIKEVMKLKKFDKDMLAYIQKLRKDFDTAYLTNYADDYWKILEKMFPFDKYFDYGLVSYKIGERKPAKKGFELILKNFNVKPEETLYIDDSEKNLKNPKEMGIKVILFRHLEQLKYDLEKLTVK